MAYVSSFSEGDIEALTLIDSLEVSTPEETGFPYEFMIVGAVAGEIAIVIALIVLLAKILRSEFQHLTKFSAQK